MRSKRLFNLNYFIQNILKSKAVIALVLGIIPILNVIFVMILGNNSNIELASLNEISIINIFGMYVIPIVISLCLLGYVFKKKSVDFINSMPLSKREIYVTNALGGILLIVLMQIINTILLGIESLIFTNIIIPFSMIIDYFVVWVVSYIFVFMVSLVATSVSGNHITMIVVTLLILFFVPFLHYYITGFNNNMYDDLYYITDSKYTSLELNNDIYIKKEVKDVNYTLPFNYLTLVTRGDVTTYSIESIIKMVSLSVIYFFLGMYLFEKRKMEVNETSFKNNIIHYLVKSLTMLPICTIALIILNTSFSFTVLLFLLAIIIAYSIVYDLVSVRSIKSFKLGVLFFIGSVTLYSLLYYAVIKINDREETINIDEIQSVATYLPDIDYLRDSNEKLAKIFVDDNNVIDIVKKALYTKHDNSSYKGSVSVRIKLNNNNTYDTTIYLNDVDYNKLENYMLNNKKYIKEYKNIDFSKVKAVSIGNISLTGERMQKVISEIEKVIKNSDIFDLYKKSNVINVDNITLYSYDNHKNISYVFDASISEEILKDYIKYANEDFENKLKNARYINIYTVVPVSLKDYESNSFEEYYYDLYNLNDYSEIVKFMKENVNVENDLNNLIKIEGNMVGKRTYQFNNFTYFTSDIQGIQNALKVDATSGGK